MRERLKRWGPSKHGAKQKAFVTVLAWSRLFVTAAWKSPKFNWGAFPALKNRRGEGDKRGISKSFKKSLTRTTLIEGASALCEPLDFGVHIGAPAV